MFMKTFMMLLAVTVCVASTAFANDGDCKDKTVTGTFSRFDANSQVLDQLILGSNGTAYFNQSTEFEQFITGGGFLPGVGTWACMPDGTVVVTTITVQFASDGTDLVKDHYERFTLQLSVIDNDTLQGTTRVFRKFALTDDPLGPNGVRVRGCSPATVPCSIQPYKRIKAMPSDLP